MFGAASLVVAAGCDPAAGIRIRTRLRPTPAPGCLDTALANSPLLWRTEEVNRSTAEIRRQGRLLYASVRHDTRSPYPANLQIRTLGDSVTNLLLDYVWIGRLRNIPDSSRKDMADKGRSLLRQLRTACAPGAPDSVTCEQYEAFNKHPPACGAQR